MIKLPLRLTKIFFFQAGENMTASEWIYIEEEPTIMRCSPSHPDFDGLVAYYNGVMEYIKGDIVPVYLIIKEKEKKKCPRCDGEGYI